MADTLQIQACVEKCREKLDLSDSRRINEYYYTSLPFCILDAVFSIGARYSSTERVVERYAKTCELNKYTFESFNGICTIQKFISDIESMDSVEAFARNVLNNRQRTSPRNGIYKAEACYHIAKIMRDFSVNTLDDFKKLSNETLKEISDQILLVRGQSSGIMLRYLIMLTGDDNTCKPDRHIRTFLKSITGESISDSEIQELLTAVTGCLKEEYPHLTVRRLDNLIWNHQRTSKTI